MVNTIKEQQDILEKLKIYALNPMQEKALEVIDNNTNTILLSPTGTGETWAFLLPLNARLNPASKEVQVLIVVPSRELAVQIEQVIRNMGSGYKANAIYGGRSIAKDKTEFKHTPTILIGTPGRLFDHFEQERFTTDEIKTLVIDEYDVTFEVCADGEMKDIISYLPNLTKRILTSATKGVSIPSYLKLDKVITLNYLNENESSKLVIKTIVSASKNKHNTIVALLHELGNDPGIIFCNKKERLEDLSRFLDKIDIAHTRFYADMEQRDRERALIQLRNGSVSILIASDLASRGLDIPEMKFIIHYEIPTTEKAYTHRNGRTARVNAKGTAYLIKGEGEVFPDFIGKTTIEKLTNTGERKPLPRLRYWTTLFISGGRKDKISKGDIAGLFFKQGQINKDQLGIIELKPDCAFVAVPTSIADELIEKLDNSRLKKKKVRVTLI